MNIHRIDEAEKIKYDKKILTEIIFGLRTPQDKKTEIYNVVKNNYDLNGITFYKIVKSDSIEMKREKILDINDI